MVGGGQEKEREREERLRVKKFLFGQGCMANILCSCVCRNVCILTPGLAASTGAY